MPNIEFIGFDPSSATEIKGLIIQEFIKHPTVYTFRNDTVFTFHDHTVVLDIDENEKPFIRVSSNLNNELQDVRRVLEAIGKPLDVEFIYLHSFLEIRPKKST